MITLGSSLIWAGKSANDAVLPGLTARWKASFSASPWSSLVNGFQLSEATNPPNTAAAQNGFVPANFDGTNDILSSSGSFALSDLVSADAGSGWILCLIDAIVTDNGTLNDPPGSGNIHLNEALFSANSSPWYGLCLRLTGPTVYFLLDDGTGYTTASETISTGSYQLIQFRHDGSNIELRVNGGSWQSAASGGLTSSGLGTLLRLGTNFTDSEFADFRVLDLGFAREYADDVAFDNLRAQLGTTYNLSL